MDLTNIKKDEKQNLEKLLADPNFLKIPKVGDVVKGTVLSISKNEVHLDIEGLTTGIVRGRELCNESSEYADLKPGDETEATVLELENERGEMELSFRFAGHKKIWDKLNELLKSGEIVNATVTDANKGGLMVNVNKIMGFLPVSQLAPEHYPRIPGGEKAKILEKLRQFIGEQLEVKIIDANGDEEKLIVSEKAAWEERQKNIISSYKVGDVVTGTISALADFGAFVKFSAKGNGQTESSENNLELEGLVHISELAWQRIEHPEDVVRVGEQIKAEIIGVEGSKIFLSMKKLIDDPWKKIAEKYKIGQIVPGKILKLNPFGLFVELDPEIHGLAHISALSEKPIQNPSEVAKIGDTLNFKIISIEPIDHRLGLSLRLNEKTPTPAEEATKVEEKTEEKKEETPVEPQKTEEN
jgi:ribosomal protein S1